MKRRIALKHLGAGFSAGLVLPWLSACREDEIKPEYDYKGTVGIIGAGAAGLFAADYLLSKGINVVVFEASERLGGRIRTLRPFDKTGPGLWFNDEAKLSSDFPVELGAGKIYGDNSVWARFIQQHKFATIPSGSEAENLYWLNEQLINNETAITNPDFAAAYSFLQGLITQTGSAGSVQDAINGAGISTEMHRILNSWIGNNYGTTNSRLGIGGIASEISARSRNDNNLMLVNTPMADVLIEGYIKASQKTQLNTVIKSVDYQGEKILLSGEKTTGGSPAPFSTEVDKLIVTVPVSVLKSGDITFTPGLPAAKQSALANIGMDTAIRVVLDFRRNFWGSGFRNIYGGAMPEYFNSGAGRSTVARTLYVTISGEKAEELSPLGLDIIPAVLGDLDLMYESQASELVRRDPNKDNYVAVVQDWGKEPFIKGSMSYLKPGGTMQHRETLAAGIGGKVFFAGEATDFSGDAGTVNGAMVSGERAALEVLSSIS